MAAVTICSDFGAQVDSLSLFRLLIYLPLSGVTECHDLSFFFLMFSFKLALSFSSFTPIKRLFSPSLLSAIRVVSSAYVRLFVFLPPILIPVCHSSSPLFLVRCSANRLNKHGDSRQTCCTPFSILNQQLSHIGF